ncbi:MAG TPA: peptidoglycan DD-metalloendopeptidase family protein [Myxococcaceae bacterium]|nr:peptidoglycan DD-metalloendopeptidase family protein [Myxococcaceae bacterium]
MRPGRQRAAVVAALLLFVQALPARAEDVDEKQADVQQKLAAERANLALLRSKRLSVLELLELMEKLSQVSSARAKAVDGQIRILRKRIEVAERIQAVADRALSTQLARLAPRLTVMYRVLRRNPLESLLSADDFAVLMWRARAMTRLLDSDLRLLAEVRQAVEFQQRSVRELTQLTSVLDGQLAKLQAESVRAARHKGQLALMVNTIGAQAVESARVIHELEVAERELADLIAGMQESTTTGFGALKGQLALPAEGAIEVGFGKQVNPRFNTVTVQKGLDIRAPEGAPVTAVAPGKVVYAGWLRGYGNLLVLDHGGGYHSLVAHLAELGKAVGDPVQRGELLGTVGDTGSLKGAYLYFELRKRGQAVDPAPWLAKRK